jgi:hypothetical protein
MNIYLLSDYVGRFRVEVSMSCELRIYLYVKVASRISFEQHFKDLRCKGFQGGIRGQLVSRVLSLCQQR